MAFKYCTNCVSGVIKTERSLEKCPVCEGKYKIPIYENNNGNTQILTITVNDTPVLAEVKEVASVQEFNSDDESNNSNSDLKPKSTRPPKP